MRKAIMAALLLTSSTYAMADIKVKDPEVVCNMVSEVGLKTRGWKNQYDQEFGCSSPYKDIGSSHPVPNNLAFYAEGNGTSVKLVKLVLNVYDPPTGSSANKELQDAVLILLPKVSGEKSGATLQKAISEGKSTSMKVGASNIKIARENWPTGKGYEIKVIFE